MKEVLTGGEFFSSFGLPARMPVVDGLPEFHDV
jgi:hypothetical protein